MTTSAITLIDFAARGGAWLVAGALLGLWHFLSLRRTAQELARGRILRSLGLQLLRFALTASALALIALASGALPLLATMGGLLVARTAVLRWELRSA